MSRVLLVDDEPAARLIMQNRLRDLGLEVIVAETDAQAKRLCEEYRNVASELGALALMSGWTGVDFSELELGSTFSMDMKFGPVPYKISSTVVEFEQDRKIAWAHLGKHRWRYELEPNAEGTLVRETFDWSTAMVPKAIELMGYPKKHPANMEATLERLAAIVEA